MKIPSIENLQIAILWLSLNEGVTEERQACENVENYLSALIDKQNFEIAVKEIVKETSCPVNMARKILKKQMKNAKTF